MVMLPEYFWLRIESHIRAGGKTILSCLGMESNRLNGDEYNKKKGVYKGGYMQPTNRLNGDLYTQKSGEHKGKFMQPHPHVLNRSLFFTHTISVSELHLYKYGYKISKPPITANCLPIYSFSPHHSHTSLTRCLSSAMMNSHSHGKVSTNLATGLLGCMYGNMCGLTCCGLRKRGEGRGQNVQFAPKS